MRKSGFTLIELLVVIAIIAILAAILFPVFASAKEKSRQAVCFGNMKQLGMGTMLYLQDWQEAFPITGGPRNAAAEPDTYSPTSWGTKIMPYVKNKAVFLCPSVKRAKGVASITCSYGNNASLGVLDMVPKVKHPGDLKRPSRIVMWFEPLTLWLGAPYNYGKIEEHMWSVQFAYVDLVRHQGGTNFTFADGHAKWYRGIQNFLDPYTGWIQQGITFNTDPNLKGI